MWGTVKSRMTITNHKKEMAAGGAGLPRGAPPPDPGPLPPTQPAGINWRFARSRALIAAIVLVVLMLIPVTRPLVVIWIPLCGALCVFLYQRRFPATPISSGAGARMALSAGAMAFAIVLLFSGTAALLEHFVNHHSVLADVRSYIVEIVKANPSPQTQQALDLINTDGGLVTLMLMLAIVELVLFLALSAVGGAIQARILKPTGAR